MFGSLLMSFAVATVFISQVKRRYEEKQQNQMHVLDTWKPLDSLSFTKGDGRKIITNSIAYIVDFFYIDDLTGFFFFLMLL